MPSHQTNVHYVRLVKTITTDQSVKSSATLLYSNYLHTIRQEKIRQHSKSEFADNNEGKREGGE